MGRTRVLDETPSSLSLMVRAALPAIPGVATVLGVRKTGGELPDLTLERRSVPVDRARVRAYADVCGFPHKDALPLPYLHMLAFPLHMALLTDRSFPFPAMGLVHLGNTIEQLRRVTSGERFDIRVRAASLRPHTKGRAFDMVTEVEVDGEPVWREVSAYLRRGGDDPTAQPGPEIPTAGGHGTEWRLPGDLGRRYAAVSRDRNPIHLYAATAKAFGFPRQIAHGMWSKARCVAALENRLTDRVRVEAAFKTPVLLPATVRFTTAPDPASDGSGSDPGAGGGGLLFGLVNPRDGAPHLAGRASPMA